MKRLERLKLYGDGLVSISSPALVGRYNDTLDELGLPRTDLSEFHVDGLGWSPEIAAERSERYYLSHGMANPLAIIVTPDQRNKPVYAPFASYDRSLMATYFDQFITEVADLTRDTAIWLGFDRQLSRFNNPHDLLLVQHVTVRSHAGRLTEAGRDQHAIVSRFQDEELGWFDANLRDRIVASAKAHGDLRFRRLAIPDLRYAETRTFYTGLFGGLFVLRNLRNREHLLILQDDNAKQQLLERSNNTVLLTDPTLPRRLIDEDVFALDVGWYRGHRDALREKMEYIALDAICGADPEVDFGKLTSPQRQQRVRTLGDAMPNTYFELERLIAQLQIDDVDPGGLSPELRLILLHPHQRFEPNTTERDLIWQLLCRLSSIDIMRLYIADKEYFFEAYKTWPESKKRWVAHRIASDYRPRMER